MAGPEMMQDEVQVGVGLFEYLVNPVHRFNVGITAQLAEGGRTFQRLIGNGA